MKTYILQRTQQLPISIQKAWEFFSAPGNLAKITPPSMDFKVISPLTNHSIYNGMEIEYRVKPLLSIPVKWVTLISEVSAPYCFKDIQLKGPYQLWEHTHTFKETDNGVEMKDEVKYALPLGPLGTIAHSIIIKKQLEYIFNYRQKTLNYLFDQNGNTN